MIGCNKEVAVHFLSNGLYFGRRDSSVSTCGFIVTTLRSYKPTYHMYRCLISVTAEAQTAAGTRDATLMAIDTGLWMKSVENGGASFFLPSLCWIIRLKWNRNFLLALTVAHTMTGCNTKFGYAQHIVFGTWWGGRNTDYRGDHFIEDMNVVHVLGDCSRLCMVTVLQ